MKVFRLNDCDWWMAETMEQAKADYLKMTGEDSEIFDDPKELTAQDMEDHEFYPDESVERAIPFSEELRNRIVAGRTSELFASTEY